MNLNKIGEEIHQLATKLWPINRSLTGYGVRETLAILKEQLPELIIHEVPSGTKAFDWVVPNEWNVETAYVVTPKGEKILDFSKNNLHLLGYSVPVEIELSLEELQKNLYSLPDQPDAIPYMTSYYSERWGFCLTENEREKLLPGQYKVVIKSTLKPGSMTYAELKIKGKSDKEIFLSTYVCHPSMANNELSGPTVTTFLAKWILQNTDRNYSYRIIFIPETIGSITYLSKNIEEMKNRIVAGFNITCVGDERAYSYLPSRNANTLADKASLHVLKHHVKSFKKYTYLDRGSDERQYCAPGVDLPVVSIMRSKYAEFPEYHTSLDDLNFVTPAGLEGGFLILKKAIEAIECNLTPKILVLCEPQLGKRGLYPNLSTKNTGDIVRSMMDFLAYCDGSLSLLDIAEIINVPISELYKIFQTMNANGLVEDSSDKS